MTDKSLKMNNYADSKYMTKEGLQPKRSYNKVVNLNLLKSNIFWNESQLKTISTDKTDPDNENIKLIQKSMSFYSKYLNNNLK